MTPPLVPPQCCTIGCHFVFDICSGLPIRQELYYRWGAITLRFLYIGFGTEIASVSIRYELTVITPCGTGDSCLSTA